MAALFVLLPGAAAVELHLEARAFERVTRTETFAQVGQSRVRYLELGRGRPGPPVVFMNGVFGSIEQWDGVQPRIAEFAPTLAYDRAGFGLSESGGDCTYLDQARELKGLLAARGIDQPVVLIGFSMSASIARIFVHEYPDAVAGVILVEPFFLPEFDAKGPSRHTTFRDFTRIMVVQTVTTLFGVRRLGQAFDQWRGRGPKTPLSERTHEILARFGAWKGAACEWWVTDESARQSLAAGALGDVPLTIVAGNIWGEGPYRPILDGLYAGILSGAPRGTLRRAPNPHHGALLEDETSVGVLVEAIRDLPVRRANFTPRSAGAFRAPKGGRPGTATPIVTPDQAR